MKRSRLIAGLLAAMAAVVALAVGSAGASASTTLHFTFSNNWQGWTFVAGLDDCPLFGGPSYLSEADGGVNLTDHIRSTYLPYSSDGFLWRIKSVGTVAGVINAPDGTYTVTSGPLKEDRVDSLAIWFFRGSGPVTVTGPGGSVTGKATFTDLTGDFPTEEDFLFTTITSCHLS